MSQKRILILSDFHIGGNARSVDLRPGDIDGSGIDENYFDTFLDFIKKENIDIDYVFVPGDISDRAQPSEIELSSTVIQRLCEALDVHEQKILLVPGNHEVDWDVIDRCRDDPTGFRRKQRYDPILNPDWLIHQYIQANGCDCTAPPHYTYWEFQDLFVIGYNSSWSDDPSISIHHGLISESDLNEICEFIDEKDLASEKIKVFLVHHHPLQYSNPIPNEPDFSAMNNSGNLIRELQRYEFDFIVHGHKHAPYFQYESINSGFPIGILGSGSFSAILDSSWSGHVNNQFHVLNIYDRDAATKYLTGTLESWAYLSGYGWRPSEKHNGIRHKIPFGYFVQPNVFKEKLREILKSQFEVGEYVEWKEIITEHTEYRYLPPELVVNTVKKLSVELDFILHGEDSDDLILLKKRSSNG